MYITAVYTLVNEHIKNRKYKKCDITQHDTALHSLSVNVLLSIITFIDISGY